MSPFNHTQQRVCHLLIVHMQNKLLLWWHVISKWIVRWALWPILHQPPGGDQDDLPSMSGSCRAASFTVYDWYSELGCSYLPFQVLRYFKTSDQMCNAHNTSCCILKVVYNSDVTFDPVTMATNPDSMRWWCQGVKWRKGGKRNFKWAKKKKPRGDGDGSKVWVERMHCAGGG